jgi:hypothetical protein
MRTYKNDCGSGGGGVEGKETVTRVLQAGVKGRCVFLDALV